MFCCHLLLSISSLWSSILSIRRKKHRTDCPERSQSCPFSEQLCRVLCQRLCQARSFHPAFFFPLHLFLFHSSGVHNSTVAPSSSVNCLLTVFLLATRLSHKELPSHMSVLYGPDTALWQFNTFATKLCTQEFHPGCNVILYFGFDDSHSFCAL